MSGNHAESMRDIQRKANKRGDDGRSTSPPNINRIRDFVCLFVCFFVCLFVCLFVCALTRLNESESTHVLYMGRSGIYRGRVLSKN